MDRPFRSRNVVSGRLFIFIFLFMFFFLSHRGRCSGGTQTSGGPSVQSTDRNPVTPAADFPGKGRFARACAGGRAFASLPLFPQPPLISLKYTLHPVVRVRPRSPHPVAHRHPDITFIRTRRTPPLMYAAAATQWLGRSSAPAHTAPQIHPVVPARVPIGLRRTALPPFDHHRQGYFTQRARTNPLAVVYTRVPFAHPRAIPTQRLIGRPARARVCVCV